MQELPTSGEWLLKTRLEERLVHYFTPFLESLGYEWSIRSVDEYGEDVAKFYFIKK